MAKPAAGFYDDGAGRQRYWDGSDRIQATLVFEKL